MYIKVNSGMFKGQIFHSDTRPRSGIISATVNGVKMTFYPNDYEEVERPKTVVQKTDKTDRREGSRKNLKERGYLTLEEVQATGLPYFDGEEWHNDENLKDGMLLLTKTRCRRLSRTLEPRNGEAPAAYRKGNITHDYSALYDRTKRIPIEKAEDHEVYRK